MVDGSSHAAWVAKHTILPRLGMLGLTCVANDEVVCHQPVEHVGKHAFRLFIVAGLVAQHSFNECAGYHFKPSCRRLRFQGRH